MDPFSKDSNLQEGGQASRHNDIRFPAFGHNVQVLHRRRRDVALHCRVVGRIELERTRPLPWPSRQQTNLGADNSLHELLLKSDGCRAIVVDVRRPVVVRTFEGRESVRRAVCQARGRDVCSGVREAEPGEPDLILAPTTMFKSLVGAATNDFEGCRWAAWGAFDLRITMVGNRGIIIIIGINGVSQVRARSEAIFSPCCGKKSVKLESSCVSKWKMVPKGRRGGFIWTYGKLRIEQLAQCSPCTSSQRPELCRLDLQIRYVSLLFLRNLKRCSSLLVAPGHW